jgi:SAM-dependent methyltransferase
VFWPWEVVERDHEIQNPTSAEKIRLLGSYLRLDSESRVLDVACGKGGPARVLASAYGCRIRGIELRQEFAAEARRLAKAEGLASLIEVETGDASKLRRKRESHDAALCLGAAFVWGTIADAAKALRPLVPEGGHVAIGEAYWREWPLPDGVDAEDFVGLPETVERFEQAGFQVVGVIAASEDDWDRYESLHWRAIEEWLAEHPRDARARQLREAHDRIRREYFAVHRSLLGWAILVGRRAESGSQRRSGTARRRRERSAGR